MATLLVFVPKPVIWCKVEAGIELKPGGALPVGMLDEPGGVVTGTVDVGGGVAAPGRH